MLYVSGEHTLDSHKAGKGILSVKQQHAIDTSVRSSPLMTGSTVHANLKNFSPGRQVPTERRSMEAVNRLVRRQRKLLMAARIPGQSIDGSEGSMTKLAKSLSLKTALKRHNDPEDEYHMDAHQVVCLGFQFKDGVTFMCLSTPHLIVNMGRGIHCGWQTFGHLDGAFNWCNKDFGMIAFGLNSMGARYNQVCVAIVNSESRTALQHTFESAEAAFFSLYKGAKLCDKHDCSFCTTIKELAQGNSLLSEYLLSEAGVRNHYHLDKVASDQSAPVPGFAREKFGEECKVLECGQHLSGIVSIGKFSEMHCLRWEFLNF